MSRSIAIAIAVGALLAFIAAYVYAPFRAIDALGRAVKERNRDALAEEVDFAAVRESLKDGFVAHIERRATEDRGRKKNPLFALALAFAPALANSLVDSLVTPDGIILVLSQPLGGAGPRGAARRTKWNRSWSFPDTGHFRASYTDAGNPDLAFGLVFERQGVFAWRLVRLDLPEDEIMRRIEHMGDTADDSGSQTASSGNAGGAGAAGALPKKVGACATTTVKDVSTRLLEADGAPISGSGSAIAYVNGGYQVSYGTIEGIEHSQVGDSVRLCLAEIPQHCPPGDARGRVYSATNLRTHEQWTARDSEHSCGGA